MVFTTFDTNHLFRFSIDKECMSALTYIVRPTIPYHLSHISLRSIVFIQRFHFPSFFPAIPTLSRFCRIPLSQRPILQDISNYNSIICKICQIKNTNCKRGLSPLKKRKGRENSLSPLLDQALLELLLLISSSFFSK